MHTIATLPRYPDHLLVTVFPFAQRAEGDEVIIANQSRSSFLSVPTDAVEVLELLGSGRTVGETQAEYERQHGVRPDLDDLLEALEHEGFLHVGGGESATPVTPISHGRRYHFENIPVEVAGALFGRPVLGTAAVLIALGLVACALDPSVLPRPSVLVFQHDQVGMLAAWLLLSLVGVFIHEMAHLVAARAAGVPSRLGLGNRLWVLVAETDMTGIWMASRAARCLAFLAGPLVDVASAAPLVLLIFADHQRWLQLDPTVLVLTQAVLFQYLARLLWQLEFFVPTDFYYVIGTALGCKSLMDDTQTFLVNQLARVFRGLQIRDQSTIPTRERRAIHMFAIVWLVGRAVAFATLFWITLPVLVGYLVMVARGIGSDTSGLEQSAESFFPLTVITLQTVGLAVWIRGIMRAAKPTESSIR